MKKLQQLYNSSKSAKVGDMCICPSCKEIFIKESYQQAFCKTKTGTQCKDYYWNNVTPGKKNNTTRISPANRKWKEKQAAIREMEYDPDKEMHPNDPYSLGQWDD